MFDVTEVQREALIRSYNKPGFAYFMEMGLGKTRTDLIDTMEAAAAGWIDCAVVVCPNSFKEGWVAEIEKWNFSINPHVYESGANASNRNFLKQKFTGLPMVIINYEALRTGAGQDYILQFIKGRKAKITADESIQIKTYNSAQTKSALALSKYFVRRRILSGKPMTQGPHDIWAQMRFIGGLENYNYFAFKTIFCKMGGFKGKQVIGTVNPERLASLLDPLCYKAEKKDSLNIPKTHSLREYKLGPTLQKHYDNMMDDFVVWLESGETVTIEAAITKFAKLQQIQSGFIITEEGKIEKLVDDNNNPRLCALVDLIETELIGKICVPYHHLATGRMLMQSLAKYQPAMIAGKDTMNQSETDVEAEKKRFNDDPNCRVIILQTKAAKYGHTLLAGPKPEDRCYTMAFFENTYSLDDRSQIEDRIHRTGQKADGCNYIDFVGTPLDKSVAQALDRKESVYKSIMDHVTRRA